MKITSFIILSVFFLSFSATPDSITVALSRLSAIKEMPYIPLDSGDKEFWNVTCLGSQYLNELCDKITDSTKTEADVPLFGGKYSVGDICIRAIWEIIPEIPITSFVADTASRDYKDRGFSVYWEYVRENIQNRIALQNKVKKWISLHRGLVRIRQDGHPCGGFWCTKEWMSLKGAHIISVKDSTGKYLKSNQKYINR